jgi:hypothetical protein
MHELEAGLRRALEAVHGRVTRLGTDMLLLEHVPTDKRAFSKERTNLLVVHTCRPQLPYLVLVDEDLSYGGADPFLNSVFADPSRNNGWRPLLLAPNEAAQSSLPAVARAALRLLGFTAPANLTLPHGFYADWGFREAQPPLIGRESLLERAEAVLAQETERAAVVLVGPSGVGKTALARELAWRWQEEGKERTAVRVDLAAVLGRTSFPGERTERLQQTWTDAVRLGQSTLVMAEDIRLACTGSLARRALCGAIDAGLRLCATATRTPASAALADPALRRRLHFLTVPEPDLEELTQVLLPAVARHLEVRYGLGVAAEALTLAATVSERMPGAQPGKVLRVLDNALARARRQGLQVLGPDDVLGAEMA